MAAKGRSSQASPGVKVVRGEIAARYGAGQERKVRSALGKCGNVNTYPSQRIVVLKRAPGVTAAAARTVLDELQRSNVIEYVTPVLRDRDTNSRQVLTDEIVVRLKPGRTRRALAALESAHGFTITRRNEFEPSQYIVTVPNPSGTQTLDVARSIDRSDDVEFASPNFLTQVKR